MKRSVARACERTHALVVAVVLAAGCGAGQKDTETLAESIRDFNDGVRWQRYAVAASSLPPAERSQFVVEMDERANELKIADYEIIKVDTESARAAKVQVKLSWYRDSEGTLHETHAVQSWERHGKSWWMVDAVRLRGAEMPGLTETAEPADPAPPADPAKP